MKVVKLKDLVIVIILFMLILIPGLLIIMIILDKAKKGQIISSIITLCGTIITIAASVGTSYYITLLQLNKERTNARKNVCHMVKILIIELEQNKDTLKKVNNLISVDKKKYQDALLLGISRVVWDRIINSLDVENEAFKTCYEYYRYQNMLISIPPDIIDADIVANVNKSCDKSIKEFTDMLSTIDI